MLSTASRAIIVATILSACDSAPDPAGEPATPDYAADARRITTSAVVVDTHIDVPIRLLIAPADVSRATETGDFDYPRAVIGGLNAPFMSIYTSPSLEALGESKAAADGLIDLVERIAADAPDKFAIATSVADVRSQFRDGVISLAMGMENGSPIAGDIDNLRHFYARGIRYVSLAHGESNHLSDSSYDETRQWHGISAFGAEVVREMNRLGIMVDVSHVSDDAYWQILAVTQAPVIASHSSARHFTPELERNMSDDMIRAIAENGGVVQVNFGSAFINQQSRVYAEARKAAAKRYLLEHPGLTEVFLYHEFPKIYAVDNGPMIYASLDEVLDHFDHIVGLVGVDHVGIGSDFDGVGDSLPVGLKDVSSYPNLVEGLLRRGYSEEDVRKILGENLLRVWQAVEDYAASTSSST